MNRVIKELQTMTKLGAEVATWTNTSPVIKERVKQLFIGCDTAVLARLRAKILESFPTTLIPCLKI